LSKKNLLSGLLSRRTLLASFTLPFLNSCRKNRSDPKKITMRPRVFLEGAAPIPILDEYDFTSIQIGTVDNILTDNPTDRRFALWFGLDRRSATTLQKETIRNIGKRLHLVIGGQTIGVHPIERSISTGVLPFVLSSVVQEENALTLFQELNISLIHIKAEFAESKE
jgi:hypothetical protein